jgi:hypothetical protein
MGTINLGQLFVEDPTNCPQCTWFVETDLPAGDATWPHTAKLTVVERTRPDGSKETVFELKSNPPTGNPLRKLVPPAQTGSVLRGAARMDFQSVMHSSSTMHTARLGTSTVAGITIHTVSI